MGRGSLLCPRGVCKDQRQRERGGAHQKIPRQEVASDEIFWTSLRHEGDGARKNLGSGLGRLAAS